MGQQTLTRYCLSHSLPPVTGVAPGCRELLPRVLTWTVVRYLFWNKLQATCVRHVNLKTATHRTKVPKGRVQLAMKPTPIHPFALGDLVPSNGPKIWVKRDDLTGMQLSGNKVSLDTVV